MARVRRLIVGVCFWIAATPTVWSQESGWTSGRASRRAAPVPSAPGLPLGGTVDPKAFGTHDYTITVISGLDFNSQLCPYQDAATLSSICHCNGCTEAAHSYATLDIPAGAVIDYIGVNNATPVDASMGFTLHFRDHLGGSAQLLSFSFPAHEGFATDMAGPLGILIPDHKDRAFILDVERAPAEDVLSYFGYVEVWWRRTVSEPPATPTFGDVPNGHPFYQFIEALAASGITGGCGDGSNYCPDAALTRGQMAVFLSKALGLHWPN